MRLQTPPQVTSSNRWLLFFVNRERQVLDCHPDDGTPLRLPLDCGLAGHVVASAAPLSVADARVHPQFSSDLDDAMNYRTKSTLCIPIVIGDRILGVVQLLNKTARDGGIVPYTQSDQKLLTKFAGYLAACVLTPEALARDQECKVLCYAFVAGFVDTECICPGVSGGI